MKIPSKRTLSLAAAASLLSVVAACGGSDASDATSDATTAAATPDGTASADATAGSSDASGSYQDGDYEAEGSYPNPGGNSSVVVDLTLEGGVVTALEVTPEAQGTSLQYQRKFVSGIAAEVVGKKLDDLDVSKVAGSSLTSQGFNAALEEIKADASA